MAKPDELAQRADRKARQAVDAAQAMREYHKEAEATRLKTERLKAARLAKEATPEPAPVAAKPAKPKRGKSATV